MHFLVLTRVAALLLAFAALRGAFGRIEAAARFLNARKGTADF